ncbi:MAG: Fe-S cluster assembly protein HesB [Bacteroidota bacterium]
MSAKHSSFSSFAPQLLLEVDALLFEHYGGPFRFFGQRDPLSEMVSALLSHRTKNSITRKAYQQLKSQYDNWAAVRDAPTADIATAISVVTFPEVKAPRIQEALRRVGEMNDGKLSLDFLADLSVAEARQLLERIPGVGVKTSAAILSFSRLHLPALVVDMHHLRVTARIGIVPQKSSLDRAARQMETMLPADWDGQRVYDHHQALMRHGQRVCHWQHPNCKVCVVRHLCRFYQTEFTSADTTDTSK